MSYMCCIALTKKFHFVPITLRFVLPCNLWPVEVTVWRCETCGIWRSCVVTNLFWNEFSLQDQRTFVLLTVYMCVVWISKCAVNANRLFRAAAATSLTVVSCRKSKRYFSGGSHKVLTSKLLLAAFCSSPTVAKVLLPATRSSVFVSLVFARLRVANGRQKMCNRPGLGLCSRYWVWCCNFGSRFISGWFQMICSQHATGS
jgi:hypothetical protein